MVKFPLTFSYHKSEKNLKCKLLDTWFAKCYTWAIQETGLKKSTVKFGAQTPSHLKNISCVKTGAVSYNTGKMTQVTLKALYNV